MNGYRYAIVTDDSTGRGQYVYDLKTGTWNDVLDALAEHWNTIAKIPEDEDWAPAEPVIHALDDRPLEGNLVKLTLMANGGEIGRSEIKIVRDSHYSDGTCSYFVNARLPDGGSERGSFRATCPQCHAGDTNPDNVEQHGR